MKSLAELKRLIKPGVRLLCIENTLRPEFNGTVRKVEKAQGNSFAWRFDPEPVHELVGNRCVCGKWQWDALRTYWSIEEQYEGHVKSASSRSWTTYEKASEFHFDGSNTFTMKLKPGTHVKLQVLTGDVQ